MRTILADETGEVPPPARKALRDALRGAADALRVGSGDLAVRLVGEERMRELNRTWRRLDRPTDVLSFPSGATDPAGRRHLGDVAICVDVASSQARRRRHSLERELAILAVHGLLHVLGYDHETDEGEMDLLQRSLIRRLLPRQERT